MIGEIAEDLLERAPKTTKEAAARKAPTLVAKIIQQDINIRWGASATSQASPILPGAILARNNGHHIYAHMQRSFGPLDDASLARMSTLVKFFIVMMFPDGLFANGLVVLKCAINVALGLFVNCDV